MCTIPKICEIHTNKHKITKQYYSLGEYNNFIFPNSQQDFQSSLFQTATTAFVSLWTICGILYA